MSERESQPSDPPDDPAESGGLASLDTHLRVYVSDPSLWPVLLAGLLTLGTLGASLLWLAVAGRNPFALAGLAVLALICVDVWQRDVRCGRFGAMSRVLLGFWAASAGGAYTIARLSA